MEIKLKLAAAAALAAAGIAAAVPAAAADYALGAGVHFDRREYKGVGVEVLPAPIMNVETRYFYLHGLEAGGYLLKNDRHAVMLGISYMPLEFDASDSDDARMKRLDDRDASAFANLSYRYLHPWFSLGAKISGDISGESNGFLADVNVLKRFQVARLGITPEVGLTWSSSNFNDYYYGISAAESRRSGLKAYSADSSVSGYARLFLDYSFSEHLSVWLEGSVRSLGSEVKDSPMVDDTTRIGFGGGVNWRF